MDIDELDITASEKKPTYQKNKQYVLEHTGLKVSSLYNAQIKQKCGLDMQLNYNHSKSENAAVNYIINDNLETGKLKVYENLGGILTIQQLIADIDEPANAVLLAEITTVHRGKMRVF